VSQAWIEFVGQSSFGSRIELSWLMPRDHKLDHTWLNCAAPALIFRSLNCFNIYIIKMWIRSIKSRELKEKEFPSLVLNCEKTWFNLYSGGVMPRGLASVSQKQGGRCPKSDNNTHPLGILWNNSPNSS